MSWKDLKKEIEDETNRIWLKEPEELGKMMSGVIDTNAGSKDQYFSTLMYASGEIRAIAIHACYNILRACDAPEFNLAAAKKMTHLLLPISGIFLDFCGLKKIWHFGTQIIKSLDAIDSKEDLKELFTAYMNYCNRIQMWFEVLFPWGISLYFPQRGKEDVRKLAEMTGL